MALLGMCRYMNAQEPVALILEFCISEQMSTTLSDVTHLWRFTFLLMVTTEMFILANVLVCLGKRI